MRRLTFLVLLAVTALTVAACPGLGNPSYQIKVANQTDVASLVRVSGDGLFGDRVYNVPPYATLITETSSGAFNGRVELLNDDCQVVEYVDMSDMTSPVLVTFSGTGYPSADENDPQEGMPEAEVVEQCLR